MKIFKIKKSKYFGCFSLFDFLLLATYDTSFLLIGSSYK
jgi:hypothetical protein